VTTEREERVAISPARVVIGEWPSRRCRIRTVIDGAAPSRELLGACRHHIARGVQRNRDTLQGDIQRNPDR
jgi:hypothetical protein